MTNPTTTVYLPLPRMVASGGLVNPVVIDVVAPVRSHIVRIHTFPASVRRSQSGQYFVEFYVVGRRVAEARFVYRALRAANLTAVEARRVLISLIVIPATSFEARLAARLGHVDSDPTPPHGITRPQLIGTFR